MPKILPATPDLAPLETIQSHILVLRGTRVILDADLAGLYGVPTKRLNEQVKRNARRFPEDFMFRLTAAEATELLRSRSQIATLKRGQNIKHLPFAFTEHGAVQAANVLNSETAIEMGVQVVRAFNHLRRLFADHRTLAGKLAELEKRLGGHDGQIAAVIHAIRQLAAGEIKRSRRRIGFHQGNR
jgi:hypothetical protein